MAFAVSESTYAAAYRHYSAHGCVFVEGSRRSVFVGGHWSGRMTWAILIKAAATSDDSFRWITQDSERVQTGVAMLQNPTSKGSPHLVAAAAELSRHCHQAGDFAATLV